MKLYLIELKRPVDYDEDDSAIIRAKTAKSARRIAQNGLSANGNEVWLDPEQSSCRAIKIEGIKEEIILKSFNAG